MVLTQERSSVYARPNESDSPVRFRATYDNFIGGKWVAPAQPAAMEVVNPFDQSVLASHRRRYSIGCASEGDEEGIPLGVNLVAVPLLKCCTQQTTRLGEYGGVAIA